MLRALPQYSQIGHDIQLSSARAELARVSENLQACRSFLRVSMLDTGFNTLLVTYGRAVSLIYKNIKGQSFGLKTSFPLKD